MSATETLLKEFRAFRVEFQVMLEKLKAENVTSLSPKLGIPGR